MEGRRVVSIKKKLLLLGMGALIFFSAVSLSCKTGNRHSGKDMPGKSFQAWVPAERFFSEVRVKVLKGERVLIDGIFFLADTEEKRSRGLMRLPSLPEGVEGAVFVFQRKTRAGFWMKDTSIPLYILFFDEEGKYIWGTYMEPFSTDVKVPPDEYMYALEVPAERFVPFGSLSLGDFEGSKIKICTRESAR